MSICASFSDCREVGIESMKMPGANVFEIRDGKVTALALYWNREDALADLGLAE